jgi:predicted ATPase
MTNMVLTGLRGVGKTVLLETLKPIAVQAGWLWAGTDLSESTSVSERISPSES